MINLNEIAFIDTEGFDYNDGECLVRFDTVMYCPDKKLITFAVTKQGRISVLDYQVFEDERGHYIEYGNTYEKIYIDETEAKAGNTAWHRRDDNAESFRYNERCISL